MNTADIELALNQFILVSNRQLLARSEVAVELSNIPDGDTEAERDGGAGGLRVAVQLLPPHPARDGPSPRLPGDPAAGPAKH